MAVALFKRFPKVLAAAASDPVVPDSDRAKYPALAADLAIVDRVIGPAFAELDRKSLRDQNKYRLQQIIILIGSAVVTALGGVQAALSDQKWPGIVLGALGVILPLASRMMKEQKVMDGYLNARVQAERLRALHFEFVADLPPYAGPDRVNRLEKAVAAVLEGKEPA